MMLILQVYLAMMIALWVFTMCITFFDHRMVGYKSFRNITILSVAYMSLGLLWPITMMAIVGNREKFVDLVVERIQGDL